MGLSEELERRVDELAGEYVARVQNGEVVDLDALASSLPSEESRTALREVVEDTQRLVTLFPVHVRGGTLLSGRYRIGAELGSGGMGKVFTGHDLQLDREVAVKVLATFQSETLDSREQFAREARNQARFHHENVVTIHECGRDDDVDYIVMDLVDGTSVADVITRTRERGAQPLDGSALRAAVARPVPEGGDDLIDDSWWRSVARIVAQVARALEAAHAHGLVHRDIKPQNIMLRGGGSPMLLDFGLAGAGGEAGDVTRGLFGSAAYLAPEQVERESVGHDVRADVYQLGAVLYELLTLQRAFPGSNVPSILERIKRGDLRPPRELLPRVPSALEAICLCALERDPERRYPSARALREDLERFLRDEVPVAARGGAASRWLWRGRRFARRPGALVSAAAVLLAAVTGWYAFTAPAERAPVVALTAPESGVRFQALRFRPDADVRATAADAARLAAEDLAPAEPVVRAAETLDGHVDLGDDVSGVARFDVLGAQVATAHDVTVFAMSVYTRGLDAYAIPSFAERLGVPFDPEDVSWGLDVAAGEVVDVIYTVVTEPERETRERLWLFAVRDPEQIERFVAWFDRASELGDAHAPSRGHLPVPVALRLLANESLAEVARDEQLELDRELDSPLLGAARGDVLFPLAPDKRRSIDALVAEARRQSAALELPLESAEVFNGVAVFDTVFDVD